MSLHRGERRDNEKSTEVLDADLTTADSASPHWLRFSVKNSEGVEVAHWARKYPTRDAADSDRADVDDEKRHMLGEPEQAWSEVARLSGCPNPAVLAQYKNLTMTLVPAPQPKDLPYVGKRSDTNPGDPERSERGPLTPDPASPGEERERANPPGHNELRPGPAKAKAPLPRGGKRPSKAKGKKVASKAKQSKRGGA